LNFVGNKTVLGFDMSAWDLFARPRWSCRCLPLLSLVPVLSFLLSCLHALHSCLCAGCTRTRRKKVLLWVEAIKISTLHYGGSNQHTACANCLRKKVVC